MSTKPNPLHLPSIKNTSFRSKLPLLVYDGDCGFCKYWVSICQILTGPTILYQPYQKVAKNYSFIPQVNFEKAVHFIEGPDIYTGAAAVFKTLTYSKNYTFFWRFYQYSKGFAKQSEKAYRFVANHRILFSKLTKWVFSKTPYISSYTLIRRWIVRGIGAIYLIAFLNLLPQINVLLGKSGLLPATDYLAAMKDSLGFMAYFKYPTLFWISSHDITLIIGLLMGVFTATLVTLGRSRRIGLTLSWVLYLSYFNIGQPFISFQWDTLLLEAGILAIILTYPKRWIWDIWLTRLLVFRLFIGSGMTKLLSGDMTWKSLSALYFHFETQPLPNIGGWLAHQMPWWLLKPATLSVLLIEIVVPFFIFLPRRFRQLGFWLFMGLQVAILVTGNYGFFNLLTMVICLSLMDDQHLPGFMTQLPQLNAKKLSFTRPWVSSTIFVVLIFLSLSSEMSRYFPNSMVVKTLNIIRRPFQPFQITNTYGLFAVMTTSRPEIIIEGSNDGKTWKPYHMKWKPSRVDQAPKRVFPYHPRVDWQLWFEALSPYHYHPWFLKLMTEVLKQNPDVIRLFQNDPFIGERPKQIRAKLYDYSFTSQKERKRTGQWWKRTEKGVYLPPISLKKTNTNSL